ncbi:hypothetical protein AZH53_08635 [Methanomicrobiaceae archaeon CYW5]|uniref:ABC transporter ATP-binding protein n=1 Tax=Methanovulcanius yangii TaxID=1789227 RepID=UPI0029CA5657|nr:ABC transporter ATP-binding protein [Methanovulcanius yangii]MBT8508470.1 hypothetical protein [Methanovulcanius yangii]
MIRADRLAAGYGAEEIIRDISLDAAEGEFIGIIGPNGSGKTTLIKAMSRVLAARSGSIMIEGQLLEEFGSKELARTLGVVPQETAVNFSYTVRDIVMMGRFPHQTRFSREGPEDYRVMEEAMALTGIAHLADRPVTEISGGERQRVIIARALAQQPRFLLLDEATAHLDINHQVEILSIIRGLGGGVTKIGVFHDLNLASAYCDRIILMAGGEVRAVGTPAAVLTRENLRNHYGIDALIQTHPVTGRPMVLPLEGADRSSSPGSDISAAPRRRIHLVCGGGSGGGLMYRFIGAGCEVTTGILCDGDSDVATAAALGIDVLCIPPFSPIGPAETAALREMVARADVAVVTAMPVGPGNIANFEVLCDQETTPVVMYMPEGGEFTDYTDGRLDDVLRCIEEKGAVRVALPERILSSL